MGPEKYENIPQKEEDKHICLSHAINDIAEVNARARNLYNRIVHPNDASKDTKAAAQTAPPIPSLQEVLDGGAGEINQICQEIYKTLDIIEEALF